MGIYGKYGFNGDYYLQLAATQGVKSSAEPAEPAQPTEPAQ
jgi:hypothetical protein